MNELTGHVRTDWACTGWRLSISMGWTGWRQYFDGMDGSIMDLAGDLISVVKSLG